MKNKILISLLAFATLGHAYGGDSSTLKQNSTVVKICKYTGAATGALLGGILGRLIIPPAVYFSVSGWIEFRYRNNLIPQNIDIESLRHLAPYNAQFLAKGFGPIAGAIPGSIAGYKLGAKLGLLIAKHK